MDWFFFYNVGLVTLLGLGYLLRRYFAHKKEQRRQIEQRLTEWAG